MNNFKTATNLPLFEGVDCVHLRVPDLENGLAFYHDALGLKLLWRTATACGLGFKTGVTELVLSAEDLLMVDLKVEDIKTASATFVQAGSKIEESPFDIDIGQCVVVADPWGNRYYLLDTSKGAYNTTADGTVSGVSK